MPGRPRGARKVACGGVLDGAPAGSGSRGRRRRNRHGFPCGEQAPQVRISHVASKYVVARSVAKCLSDLRTVPVA